jgi:hypothetical protein
LNCFRNRGKAELMRFSCKCGQKIRVPEVHAGKKGRCPKCREIVVIPQPEPAKIPAAAKHFGDSESLSFGSTDIKLSFPDIPEVESPAPEVQQYASTAIDDARMFRQAKSPVEAQADGKRPLPWPIDIFLYPTNGAGLTQLAIFVGVPFLIGLLSMLLGPVFGVLVAAPGMIVIFVINAYMVWYVCECIRDSGNGGVRAPDVIAAAPDPWEALGQLLRIAACYVFFLAPMFVYVGFTKRFDTVFWSLGAYAAFFFPMGLLAITMFDSVNGLNPILLIASILSTFFSYCIMVTGLAAVVFLMGLLSVTMTVAGIGQFFVRCVGTYLILVMAHLLGRFYYRNAAKLNWDV